jgi:hypothetical protein
MRKSPYLIALGVVALTLGGCAAASDPPPVAPSATAVPLAPAAVGDGGRIAVALRAGSGADIVTINPDGTDITRLTEVPEFDACPDFGPGGRLIAFCSNRSGPFEIWLMDGTGYNERQLTTLNGNSTFADISPDGRKVVFCGSPQGGSEDDHDIWSINVDGSGLVQLTNSPGQDDCNPVWSPDGSKVPSPASVAASRKYSSWRPPAKAHGRSPPGRAPAPSRRTGARTASSWRMSQAGAFG